MTPSAAKALMAATRDTLTDRRLRVRDLHVSGKTTVAVLVSLGVAAFGSPASASGQSAERWPIKEFEVLNVEPAGEVPLLGVPVELLRELRVDLDNPLDLDRWKTVPLPDSTRQAIETYLKDSAGLLEQWGFPAPALEPVVRTAAGHKAHRVYIVENLNVGEEDAAGLYRPAHCLVGRETVILLDADDILDASGLLTPHGLSTVGHELFHAVQFATPFFASSCDEEVGHWITEGQAEAVGWDLVRALRKDVDVNSRGMKLWEPRSYSKRLPVPRRDPGPGKDPAYQTASFWRYLAEFQALRTPPGPEVNAFDYSYLASMLDRPPARRDCSTSEAACDSELRWLDLGVQQAFGLTLRKLYPRFIDALAVYGKHRLSDASYQANWEHAVFNLPRRDASEGCEHVYLTPEPGKRLDRDVIARFEPVAAECWSVLVEGFEDDVLVQIEVKAPPGATALSDLSAVVAGRPIDADTARVHLDPETDQPTATWWETFPLGHSKLFLLTNVAHDPANTTQMINLPITFTALEEYVTMKLSGGESEGSGAGDGDGPTPADIAQPTPIDFDVAEGYFSVGYDKGVCLVWIGLESRQEDALWIIGNLSPPITPGSYPIVNATGGQLDVVGGELHSPRYNEGGHKLRGQSGFLDIESVSHLMIVGRVQTHLEQGNVGAEVHAEFALRPGSMVGGILGPQASDHPCFTRDDAPGQIAGAGRNQEPGDDGPGDDTENGEGETTGSDTPADSGRPPTDGDAAADSGGAPDDDPDAAGDREGPAGADGDRPPREDSEAVGEATRATRMIEFLKNRGGAVRSHPQPVHGSLDPGSFNVSSDAFDLQLALPVATAAQCTGPDSQLGGLLRLIAMGITEEAPFDHDGSHLISISDAALELDAIDRRLRLTLDFEKCGPTECTSAHLVVRAAQRNVNFIPAGGDLIRVDVADAAIEGTVAGYHGACDGLLDFSFNLQTLP